MLRFLIPAIAMFFAVLGSAVPAFAQASSDDAPSASTTPDPGPHPELDPDTDYAFWCNSTIRNLVMMDVLQEKHFKRNPRDIILKLDQRIGNVALNLEKEAVANKLADYDAYYMGDTVAFSTSKNPKDLRKDLRGCRQYF